MMSVVGNSRSCTLNSNVQLPKSSSRRYTTLYKWLFQRKSYTELHGEQHWLPVGFLSSLKCAGPDRKKERTVDLVVKAALNGFKAFDTGEILDRSF